MAVNDIATGLSAAISSKPLLSAYKSMLDVQKSNFQSVLEIGDKYSLASKKLNELIGTTIAPISGAIAEIGLANARVGALFKDGLINSAQFNVTEGLTSVFIDTLKDQQSAMVSSLRAYELSGVSGLASAVASSRMVSGGMSTTLTSLPTYPSEIRLPILDAMRTVGELGVDELSAHQKELDTILCKLNPKYVEYRRGCWKTFNGKGPDYIRQASSSMRGLVDDLLHNLAPDDEVAKTSFFKSSRDSKGKITEKPTRKERIFYMMGYDRDKAEHLKRFTAAFLETYNHLSAWNHTPLQKHEFVRGTFITIEGQLISLLSSQ